MEKGFEVLLRKQMRDDCYRKTFISAHKSQTNPGPYPGPDFRGRRAATFKFLLNNSERPQFSFLTSVLQDLDSEKRTI